MPNQSKPRSNRRRRKLPPVVLLLLFALLLAAILIPILTGSPAGSGSPSAQQEAVQALSWVHGDLLPQNNYSRPGTKLRAVNAIVIHYMGNPGTTAEQNRSFFANLAVTHETYASSNFVIGMDGTIIQCVPVDEVAYCSNDRNGDTVSIECCHPGEDGKFTEQTYASLVRLTAWLCEAFDLDENDVIRHHDVTGKICPKYFVDNEDAWEQFKRDVGELLNADE